MRIHYQKNHFVSVVEDGNPNNVKGHLDMVVITISIQ